MKRLNDVQTLSQFVHNLREGVYITSDGGRILDANPAFLQMFGVATLDEMHAYTAASLLVDPERRQEEMRILRAEGAVREFELEIRRPDGIVRTVLDTAYQVVDDASGEVLYHGSLVDITDRKDLERELFELTVRDPLTGCHNRRHMQAMFRRLESSSAPLGVIVADVDQFKELNDRLGHDAGDRVLVQIARFLAQQVRVEDAVIRTGGDEFVLLLPGLEEAGTQHVVDRLRAVGPDVAPASFSLGWAVREPAEAIEKTVRRADQLLLQVKVEHRQLRQRGRA